MHTSALPTPPVELVDSVVEGCFTGVLVHAAEVRCRAMDNEGHFIPVLCLEIRLENGVGTPMRVEQPFQSGKFKEAAAAARRYKKGDRITVEQPPEGLRLFASSATHIHTHKPQAKEA